MAGRMNILRADNRTDQRPIDPGCSCYTCRTFGRAYLRHLFAAKEILGYRLATVHNLHFILGLMRTIRQSIEDDTFLEVKERFLARYRDRTEASSDETPFSGSG